MVDDHEPDLSEHIDEANEACESALEELAEVRAYTLKPEELQDLKAAQYALRNIVSEGPRTEDVAGVYHD